LLKKAAWICLPDGTIQWVRKRHYLRLVTSLPPEHEPEVRVVRHLVAPGDVVIDIGANIGVYTTTLSRLVGEGGRVFSVEPFPPTYEVLCYLVDRLGLKNVVPMNVALSDSDATVTMTAPHDPSGAETHYRAAIGAAGGGRGDSREVRATTFDSAFSMPPGTVSFVKCDVEGHEPACIRGAATFLSGSAAAWLIEVSGNPDEGGSPARGVFEVFRERGYSAWWFDGTRMVERRQGDASVNYFFLRDRHTSALRERGLELVPRGPRAR
jgi:FkbM family methyltransferase